MYLWRNWIGPTESMTNPDITAHNARMLDTLTQIPDKMDSPSSTEEPPADGAGWGQPAVNLSQVMLVLLRIEDKLDKMNTQLKAMAPREFVFTGVPVAQAASTSLAPNVFSTKKVEPHERDVIFARMQGLRCTTDGLHATLNTHAGRIDTHEKRVDAMDKSMQGLWGDATFKNELIGNLGAEVAHQQTAIGILSGKVHSIQHGMFTHFQGVVEALSAKLYKVECSLLVTDGKNFKKPNNIRTDSCQYEKRMQKYPAGIFFDREFHTWRKCTPGICYCRQFSLECVVKVDTKMPVPEAGAEQGDCKALSLSACSHGNACEGGIFQHKVFSSGSRPEAL